MSVSSFTPTKNYPAFSTLLYPYYKVTTISTADDVSYTAAQVLGGFINRDPNGDNRGDTMPTAAAMLALIEGAEVGTSFEFSIRNDANAAETITIAAGTGGTLSGSGQSTTTITIAQNNTKRFLVVFTSITEGSEAYTLYSLGTLTH